MTAHVRCLARRFIRESQDPSEVIPRKGNCPLPECSHRLLWATLVRGVINYRPPVDSLASEGREKSTDDGAWDGGGDGGGTEQVAPRVWLVDDSSDDDNNIGDVDVDESDCGASEDGSHFDEAGFNSDENNDGHGSIDDEMDLHDDGENSWPPVEDNVKVWSQGTAQEDIGDRSGAGTTNPCTRGVRLRASGTVDGEGGPAGGGMEIDLCGVDDGALSVICSGEEAPGGEPSPPSSPVISLSERLQLRRLAAMQYC